MHCKCSNDFLIRKVFAEKMCLNLMKGDSVGLSALDREVAAAAVFADLLLKTRVFIRVQSPSKEAFAYVIYSLLRRMTHVFCIETIVAELVHDDFICREVIGEIEWIHA